MKMDPQVYTRERLIAICERASVPESKWRDRDTQNAQIQVGECLMLLRAGCSFTFADSPKSDADTIWLEITSNGFQYFEIGEQSVETYYLPTEQRLDDVAGDDWY